MVLNKIIEFRKDKDPCDECLVKVMCKFACMPKFAYHSRRATLFSMLRRRLEGICMGFLFLVGVPGLIFILDFSQHLIIPAVMVLALIAFTVSGFLDIKVFSRKLIDEDKKIRRLVQRSPWLKRGDYD